MNRKIQQMLAAFTVTGILFLGVCGFAAVDASTERYMPDEYSSLFLITAANAKGIQLSMLGGEYTLSTDWAADCVDMLWQYRGILPHSISGTIYLVAKGLSGAVQS